MKIHIEIDDELNETDILIRCKELNNEVKEIQNAINKVKKNNQHICLLKENVEYYIPINKIIFFETLENTISAHSIDESYECKYKLYELEEILPDYFIRCSKSTILNCNEVLSVDRSISSSSSVSFMNTHKIVYVSRKYYKLFKNKLDEKRLK